MERCFIAVGLFFFANSAVVNIHGHGGVNDNHKSRIIFARGGIGGLH